MPLTFESISHGAVAFGFFNIESDMLLLEHYFFFASDFCGWISSLAGGEPAQLRETTWPVYHIRRREDSGDLMGAIHGVRFSGFIGELYKRFPFPDQQEDFKQNPEGYRTRSLVKGLIRDYAVEIEIPVFLDAGKGEAGFGEYRFRREAFQALLLYVWQGGYPRWRDEVRPGYVVNMKEAVEANPDGLFKGIRFL